MTLIGPANWPASTRWPRPRGRRLCSAEPAFTCRGGPGRSNVIAPAGRETISSSAPVGTRRCSFIAGPTAPASTSRCRPGRTRSLPIAFCRPPVVAEPLVDIYLQPGPRVNSNPASLRAAAARILALRSDFYSRAARRRYVLQALLAKAKLTHQPGASTALAGRLLCESRGADWRACVNAVLVSAGIFRDCWVS